jgi:hypothetical protein
MFDYINYYLDDVERNESKRPLLDPVLRFLPHLYFDTIKDVYVKFFCLSNKLSFFMHFYASKELNEYAFDYLAIHQAKL